MFRRRRQFLNWNARYPGNPAGSISRYGYVVLHFMGTLFKAHRLVWLHVYGEPVPEIDHIDGDRSNNRIENLRSATRSQNRANSVVSKNNGVGVKGVSPHKNRYHARIMHQGRAIHLGSFKTIDEAAAARRKAAERLHGEFVKHY
jgi:hypothetical protein